MKNIEIDITCGKWGLFDLFDGEKFYEDISEVFNSNDIYYSENRWYIQTIQKSKNKFIIYYIPTNSFLEDEPESNVEKYVLTKKQLFDYLLKNQKFGIHTINPQIDNVIVDNFIFYYLGGW